jgi:peptidoglycan/xylan/chitin deacetylase (PgdA/CDA1 family)
MISSASTAMRVPGSRLASTWVRRLRQALARRPLILLYHRIAAVDEDPWATCVRPEHFDEQIAALREYGEPLPFSQLLDRLEAGRLPRRTFTVSFADGYRDFLDPAKPILERHACPATLFVTTGAIGSEAGYWWDDLQALLSRDRARGATLRLEIDGTDCEWANGPSPADRQRALSGVYEALRTLSTEQQRRRVEDLRRQLGASPVPAADRRPLSLDELRQVAADGLVELGSHSVTHPVLAALSEDRQRREIADSRRFLEELTGGPIAGFAYPHGARRDFTRTTSSLVREAGYRGACAAFPGVVGPRVDRFSIPRVGVGDWDGATLARRLRLALGV